MGRAFAGTVLSAADARAIACAVASATVDFTPSPRGNAVHPAGHADGLCNARGGL
jgi:hypothetical protein